jgi:hypothetical protein
MSNTPWIKANDSMACILVSAILDSPEGYCHYRKVVVHSYRQINDEVEINFEFRASGEFHFRRSTF